MINMIFCQSCGMPLESDDTKGTNKDNTLNDDYCTYCFTGGEFVQEITMDEMITHCSQLVEEFNKDAAQKVTKEQAIAQMKEYFPKLKRWASTH